MPIALYGMVLLCAGATFTILQRALIREEGSHSRLAAAVGVNMKGLASIALYAIAVASAFYRPAISDALYIVVALRWLVPDPRIEKTLRAN